jgi:hypothetical protein
MMGDQNPMEQPQSPMGMPPPSPMDGGDGDQMPQEEMRKNLLDMYTKVQSKKGEWDATNKVAEVHLAEAKINALRKFFTAFEKAGIDPSDSDAMRNFFDTLYEKNPDLYQMIIPVIDDILGPDEPDQGMMEQQGEVGP